MRGEPSLQRFKLQRYNNCDRVAQISTVISGIPLHSLVAMYSCLFLRFGGQLMTRSDSSERDYNAKV